MQRLSKIHLLAIIALLCSVAASLLLAGCGNFFPGANQIVSLTISPLNSFILPSKTQQYSATATFGNNTTGDATTLVTWSSSSTNVATIDSTSGLATAVALGTTTISAKSGSVIANTTLTVSNKTVTSVTVNPSTVNPLTAGSTVQLSATANFSDGTNSDVTQSATWTSNATSIATVGSGSQGGLVTGVATGTAVITASYGGQSGTSTVTVQ